MLERPHIDYVPHVARDPHTVLRVPILPEGPKVPNHHAVRGSLKDVPNEGSCSARKCGRMYPGGNSSRLTFAVLLPQVTRVPFTFYSLSLSLMYNLLAIQLYSCYEHSFYWEKTPNSRKLHDYYQHEYPFPNASLPMKSNMLNSLTHCPKCLLSMDSCNEGMSQESRENISPRLGQP